ncbi:hypothetical protein HYPSUDRAFT_208621 [Hypholoma sublateritium FD-334 SS-4]|uniref:Fungal-type protein kinase domain-containing protein n=1 Tax=Hypholoma sublateritium (strain FD-334 SS-4) TaxID=945553 RepID=A0A0D2ND61_HYPSF|nr:hypothetical protein HYPSUDRAFT_208621 [Hypholoma sublateritium FD-334 SS-4]
MRTSVSHASSHTSPPLLDATGAIKKDDSKIFFGHRSSDLIDVNQRLGPRNVRMDTAEHLNDRTISGCFNRTQSGLDQCRLLYQLLESTRAVHRNCNVLQRDIRTSNIVLPDSVVPSPSADSADEHIFNEQTEYDDGAGDPDAIFFDFERAEVLNEKEDELRLPRMGTVQFMARSICTGRLIGDDAMILLFRRPPEIAESLLTRYGSTMPNRVKHFACPTPTHTPGPVEMPSATITRPALRHAAESVFWVLTWCAVCAAPAGRVSPPVPQGLWVTLTANHRDARPTKIIAGERHPAYDAVRSVINSLAAYLVHDLHWATDAPFTHPEFLHEAFQRLVLNFLGDHRDEGFMLLPTSGEPREFDSLVNYAEPPCSRREYLLRTSAKRPFSSQGGLERKTTNGTDQLE